MPLDSTKMPLDPMAWSTPAQPIAGQVVPFPEQHAARLPCCPENIKLLSRWAYFRQHRLRPVIGVATAGTAGIAATFLPGSVLEWLG
jgi:hypothetical protein